MDRVTVKSRTKVVAELWLNIKRTLRVAWQADKYLFLILASVGIVRSIFPILVGYALKVVLDQIVISQTTNHVLTGALLGFFAFRYLIDFVQDFTLAFQYEYIDRLFMYRLENFLTLEFTTKLSELDMAHFENSETQTLLQKARQAHIWRINNFISHLLTLSVYIATFVGAIIVLIPYGFWKCGSESGRCCFLRKAGF